MSKARLLQSIKSLKRDDVVALLEPYPEPKQVKDERGRNALRFLCGLPSADKTRERSLELAQSLLGLGFNINEPAFVEGPVKATPLSYAISRGHRSGRARSDLPRLTTGGTRLVIKSISLVDAQAGDDARPVHDPTGPRERVARGEPHHHAHGRMR
jgi:hypothetical protein